MIAAGVPGWGLLLPLQGVLIVFLFALEHEATHKTLFRTPWLNEWAGRLAGGYTVFTRDDLARRS